jgi:hypothetical protein
MFRGRRASAYNKFRVQGKKSAEQIIYHCLIVFAMRSLRLYAIFGVAGGSLSTAIPAKGCNPVDAVYLVLKGPLKVQASSFCLSFLGGDKTVQQTQVCLAGPTSVEQRD